jgi:hypothetical protein
MVTGSMSTPRATPDPAFWYGVPHGYHPLDLVPPADQLEALLDQVRGLPGELRDEAERVLRFYASFVTSMTKQNVRACLVGMHPDENGGFPLSVLTVTTVTTNGANAELVVASMAGMGAAEHEENIVPLELRCGTGFLAERNVSTVAPGRVPGGRGDGLGDVWQGTVAIAEADRPSVILLQMVTPAVEQAADYRAILVGVANTVTFTDPYGAECGSEAGPGGESHSRAAEVMRSDFG